MKIWSLLSGSDNVRLFTSEDDLNAAIIETIQGCKDNPQDFEEDDLVQMREDDPNDIALVEVTIDNWQDVLKRLNDEMDAAGEAHYLCGVTEHEVSFEPEPSAGPSP